MAKKTLNNGQQGVDFRTNINDNFTEIFDNIDFQFGVKVDGNIGAQLNTHEPMFTICFDDTYKTMYDGWFPFLENLGIQGSLAVCTKRPGNVETPAVMTWEQVDEMEAAGWEIMAHSVNHIAFTSLTDTEAEYELTESKAILEARGYTVNNFAWPVTENVEDKHRWMCRKYYRACRGYYEPNDNKDPLNEIAFDTFNIKSAGERVDLATAEGLAWMKGLVDQAYTEKRWLIWTGHYWTQDYEDNMDELIQYIQAYDIEILTLNDALDKKHNYIDLGNKFSVGEDGVRIDAADGKALVAYGNRTGVGLLSGEGNRDDYGTFFGYWAGRYSEGIRITAVGPEAAVQALLNASVALGFKAGRNALSGWYCLFIGYQAGQDQDGNYNVFFGQNAGKDNVADGCMGIGVGACQDNTKDHLFEFAQKNANAVPIVKGFFDTLELILGCPGTAADDAELGNNTSHFYVDEANNKLKVKVKYSDGTVKTGDVADLS